MRRPSRGLIWKIVGGIAALIVATQFVPVDRSNPTVAREIKWNSDRTRDLAVRACYDCHSNETSWPWYSRVAPVSWLVAHDVSEGRGHLNFSEWDKPNDEAQEIIEVVEDGQMPLRKYELLHPEARLSAEERETLVQGLEATLAADPPVAGDHGEGHAHDDDHQ